MWPQSVTKDDLIIQTKRGKGKGGQNKNKRDTAVRMVHKPTGIEVNCEDQRTQGQNIKIAFRRLAHKLEPLMKELNKAKRPEPSDKLIRTYREIDGKVVDARIDTVYEYDRVLFKDDLKDLMAEVTRSFKI